MPSKSAAGGAGTAPDQDRRPDVPPILQDVGFSLAPGEGLGVIGPSAFGKSTLARLLVGAWPPDAGEIRPDGATLDQWAPDALGAHVGYLPQTPELQAGTVRDNIVRFDPHAKHEDLIAAAKLTGIHDMILRLPEGCNTRIGYGGSALSGGQTQRVGLAPALSGMPELVVPDEPNANLDAEGDDALARAILAMREAGSAVIVMAHRPSAIAAVNKLVVPDGGRIADFGDMADMLRRATRAAPAAAPAMREDGHGRSA